MRLSSAQICLLVNAAGTGGRIFEIPAAFGQCWPTVAAGDFQASDREHLQALRALENGAFVCRDGSGFVLTSSGFEAASAVDHLIQRIRGAGVDPPELNDDECALLDAYLGAARPSVKLSRLQSDPDYRARLDAERHQLEQIRLVVEHSKRRLRAVLSAGSQSPNVLPAEAGSQGDKPDERGYVASPVDPAAYVPMADILSEHTPAALSVSMKELGTILEDYDTNRVRWTRPLGRNGQPMRNRRSVHLGDWAAYVKRRVPAEADGFPRLTEAELESRKAAVRNSKHAGN